MWYARLGIDACGVIMACSASWQTQRSLLSIYLRLACIHRRSVGGSAEQRRAPAAYDATRVSWRSEASSCLVASLTVNCGSRSPSQQLLDNPVHDDQSLPRLTPPAALSSHNHAASRSDPGSAGCCAGYGRAGEWGRTRSRSAFAPCGSASPASPRRQLSSAGPRAGPGRRRVGRHDRHHGPAAARRPCAGPGARPCACHGRRVSSQSAVPHGGEQPESRHRHVHGSVVEGGRLPPTSRCRPAVPLGLPPRQLAARGPPPTAAPCPTPSQPHAQRRHGYACGGGCRRRR